MNQKITAKQKLFSRKYLIYKVLTNLWFISAVWLYFYRIFLTDYQIGILDAIAFTIGLIAEVPSGALADKFGRDKMVKFGLLLAGGGQIIIALGNNVVPLFAGLAITMIGFSFISGADEALFFDQLKFDHDSTNWRKLVTRGAQLVLIAELIAVIAGGWLYSLNPRIPFILTGLAPICAALVIRSIKETRQQRTKQSFVDEVNEYLINIKQGFAQFRTQKLKLYVPIIIFVQGIFYTFGWGLLKIILLDRFQFTPFWGSVVLASSGLITIGILTYMHHYAENLSEKKIISLISIAAMSSLLLSTLHIGNWGYLAILILYAGEYILQPFMSEILNYRTDKKQRATVLSVASFLRMLPYVILAPIIGYLNTRHHLSYFLVVWSILIVASLLLYLSLKKRDIHISMVEE